MNQKKTFKPQDLRNLLGFLLFVLIAGSGALFYFGLGQLESYSTKVNQELATANANEKQLDDLRALRSALANNTGLVAKVDSLFTTQAGYKSQLESDIKNLASAAGITVDGITFDDEAASQGRYIANLRFGAPVEYTNFIKFLDGIETNTPKLQVETLTINRVESNKAMIAVSNVQVKVAVR